MVVLSILSNRQCYCLGMLTIPYSLMACSVLGWFLGGLDGFLYALVALMVADYITGVMCAIVDKTLSSEVGFRGIFKKVLILVLVGIGHIIDTNLIGD